MFRTRIVAVATPCITRTYRMPFPGLRSPKMLHAEWHESKLVSFELSDRNAQSRNATQVPLGRHFTQLYMLLLGWLLLQRFR